MILTRNDHARLGFFIRSKLKLLSKIHKREHSGKTFLFRVENKFIIVIPTIRSVGIYEPTLIRSFLYLEIFAYWQDSMIIISLGDVLDLYKLLSLHVQ